MKRVNTSDRLKEIMEERSLKQVDILNMVKPYCEKYGVKMNKSDLSQYISGKVSPSQDKLVVLGMALGVSESWLMGMNTEKDRQKAANDAGKEVVKMYLDNKEFFEMFASLTEEDKTIIKRITTALYGSKKA